MTSGRVWKEPSYREFHDPRLVAIYDTVNPIAQYQRFYLELAEKLPASSIIDIGCGTGLLTCELAKRGHKMIGVEPSSTMLDAARLRTDVEDVRWIEGDVTKLNGLQADLAIMTGHVAQFFLDDESWNEALKAVRKALRPGGHLAFESRDPTVQPWANRPVGVHDDWPSQTSRRSVDDPVAGGVEWWMEIVEVRGSRVRYENHYLFTTSSEKLVSVNELKFRTQLELSRSLENAGFTIESVSGHWDGRPVDAGSSEFIFVASHE